LKNRTVTNIRTFAEDLVGQIQLLYSWFLQALAVMLIVDSKPAL
jgi:hypothetical protein